ncbi:MAG: V-type ATP synthase subunit F [Eubacterium sp.]|nr:V-type ATP synthase subunit F [Eubacterium sp.]
MNRVAVIGDYDSIYGFAALGLDIFAVEGRDEGREEFKKLLTGQYSIIYIVESLAERLKEEIEQQSENLSPAIILIPGIKGNTGEGVENVKKFVEQAVGSDILFSNDKSEE